jgi:hypothetical protein
MPINSQIDSSLGVIFSTFQGVVTKEDISGQVEGFKTDPAFQPSFNHLIDTRGTTRFDLSSQGMRLVSMHSIFNEKSRRAIVAEKKEIFGIARMYQLLREVNNKPDRVQVFRTMAEARRWLGLD